MSSSEALLKQLRDRAGEPMIQRLMLADIAKTYGDGFAETLRKQLERQQGATGR